MKASGEKGGLRTDGHIQGGIKGQKTDMKQEERHL